MWDRVREQNPWESIKWGAFALNGIIFSMDLTVYSGKGKGTGWETKVSLPGGEGWNVKEKWLLWSRQQMLLCTLRTQMKTNNLLNKGRGKKVLYSEDGEKRGWSHTIRDTPLFGPGQEPWKSPSPKPRAPQSFPQTEAKPRNTNNLESFRKLIISPWCHWVINSREFINLHFLTHCPNTIITIYKN